MMKDDFYTKLNELIKNMSKEEIDRLIDFAHALIARRTPKA